MLSYEDYLVLSHSDIASDRGRAAHTTAIAYLSHEGPVDEKRALYEAMVAFLADPAPQVRAALAYGLLKAVHAPRPLLLVLLRDHPSISKAVAQYSEAINDSDLLLVLGEGRDHLGEAIARRPNLSRRLISTLLASGNGPAVAALAERNDIRFAPETLMALARHARANAPALRTSLLARMDLPDAARDLLLSPETVPQPQVVTQNGAAVSALTPAFEPKGRTGGTYLMRLLVEGELGSFLARLAVASGLPLARTEALITSAAEDVLIGLFELSGVEPVLLPVLSRLVLHLRSVEFETDLQCRLLTVSALLNDLIAEHGPAMPTPLALVADYLRTQERLLGRAAETRRAA